MAPVPTVWIMELLKGRSSTGSRPRHPAPGPQETLRPLAGLLADPSPTVWKAVRAEVHRLGRRAEGWLRGLARNGVPGVDAESAARVRARARRLLLDLGRKRVARRLAGFAARGVPDLERGLWLLSRFEEPDLDTRPYVAALDAMAAEVGRRIEARPPGIARSLVLCEYLGRELGIAGNTEDFHHPDNIYLHRAIVKRAGMPLTLAAIYHLVGRRAGISTALVGLPGHVVLRLHAPDRNELVDPFAGGETLTEQQCLRYLADHGLPFDPVWFRDAAPQSMFRRHLLNLRGSYSRRGLGREVRLAEEVLRALPPSGAPPRPAPAQAGGAEDDTGS